MERHQSTNTQLNEINQGASTSNGKTPPHNENIVPPVNVDSPVNIDPTVNDHSIVHRVSSENIWINSLPPIQEPSTSHRQNPCYNCNELSHHHRKCTAPRRMFCFRCGLPGVIRRTCTRCLKKAQGNCAQTQPQNL